MAAPGYFKQRAIEASVRESNKLLLEEEKEDETDETKERRSVIEDKLYDECQETDVVPVGDGFVTYCKHFKYLGSWISFTLKRAIT